MSQTELPDDWRDVPRDPPCVDGSNAPSLRDREIVVAHDADTAMFYYAGAGDWSVRSDVVCVLNGTNWL